MGTTPASIGPRSFVLLAGGVRAQSLPSRLGRSVLDLPLSDTLQLVDVWLQRIAEAHDATDRGRPPPEVRVLVGPDHALPTLVAREDGPRLHTERDTAAYRGTAGVLRDLCDRFEDDDHVLVGTASQCPEAGLLESLLREADPATGVTLGAGPDGRPSGLLLVRCAALREVPAVGFIDLKEQALPGIARSWGVRVLKSARAVCPPIRDRRSYLGAVRSWHRAGSLASEATASPFEERWQPTFSLVEPGAEVGAGARLHDSVVLRGGRVEAGAQLVRSVVGPGGVVRRRDLVVERLVVGRERAAGGNERANP